MGLWEDGIDDCYTPSDYKSTDNFWKDGIGSTLDDVFNITESMAEYEAEQEAEKEDVHEYVKGQAMNIGMTVKQLGMRVHGLTPKTYHYRYLGKTRVSTHTRDIL